MQFTERTVCQRHCPVRSLQGPRLADTAFASAMSATRRLSAGAGLGLYSRDQLRDVEPMQRTAASVSICGARQQSCSFQIICVKIRLEQIYTVKKNSPNEEIPLHASKPFWTPVCTEKSVFCIEGCSSKACGSAAVICCGYFTWAGSPPGGRCPCGA